MRKMHHAVIGLLQSPTGRDVPQDYAEAARWFPLAAEQGHASAQYGLGLAYTNGDDVPQDYVQAHMWHNLAAARVTTDSYDDFREAAPVRRDALAALMTPAKIAEAQRLAREWDATHPR